MKVMKMKGAVLQDREALVEVKKDIMGEEGPCIVVISALKGAMPRLRQLYALSLRQGSGFEEEFREFRDMHLQLAETLLAGNGLEEYRQEARKHLDELYDIMHNVAVLKESSHPMKDYILSKGDILASLMFSKLFPGAVWTDSRNFILTDSNFGAPEVYWEESCEAVRKAFKDLRGVAVVPGYCGKTREGYSISLGRVGLSLTASVVKAAFA